MATHNPLAVLVGFIGKFPVAGMTLYNLHHIVGLQALGYDVHYVERQNVPNEYYDPISDGWMDEPTYALGYLETTLAGIDVTRGRYTLIDRRNQCYGSDWQALRTALDRADFVLTLADPAWFDELGRCPRRAFIDGDPMLTQVAILGGNGPEAEILDNYDVLFTYGVRMGMQDCTIPSLGRKWLPARPVVATELWERVPVSAPAPITTVMNWAAGPDVTHDGRTYGHKGREFERFIGLPQKTHREFRIAAGGPTPTEHLSEHGWVLEDPLAISRTVEEYQQFIAHSWADFGIAKHAYVASRSGWFSDRSTCYLAAGRPVLHQETGFSDWLPTGEGVLSFSTMDDVLAALEGLDANYKRHAKAARRIAEEHFEASTVIGRMLDEAGFR
jgi:hypothetical protein